MISHRIFFFSLMLISSITIAQTVTQIQPPSSQPGKSHPTAHADKKPEDVGSRVFRQNCSRCHNTPEGFSPKISETVLRHMSVRASLSMRDKAELLRFLNP